MIVTGEVVPVAVSAQVVPPSVEYWYFEIGAPPFDPAVKTIDAEPLPGVAARAVGAEGVVAEGGVEITLTELSEALAT